MYDFFFLGDIYDATLHLRQCIEDGLNTLGK
jgi:hypothetical protein